jgi:hypothetical protein
MRYAVFNFQLTLQSIKVCDQPVTNVVQGNANNSLTVYDREETILISNFHYVVNVIFFLSGGSLASVFYVPTFQNTKFRCWEITQKKEYNKGETAISKHYSRQHNVIRTVITG